MTDRGEFIHWGNQAVPFQAGETIAAALVRAGVQQFGLTATRAHARYFCGIGNCQACLVSVDGAAAVEACLTPAAAGMHLRPVGEWSEPRQEPA